MNTGLYFAIAGIIVEFSRPWLGYMDNIIINSPFILSSLLVTSGALWMYAAHKDLMIEELTAGDIEKFVKYIPIAGILCTIADIVLPIDFIAGMLIFLTAHILFILAFMAVFKPENNIRNRIILLSTLLFGILLYFGLLYKPGDFMVLVIIPYIIIIMIMLAVSITGYYSKFPNRFKLSIIIGSSLFVISDSILAISMFSDKISIDSPLAVGHTYILAIFFILHSASIAIYDKLK